MSNVRDNNADLGNQTIEGTLPPIALEAEIVLPDGSTQPISTGTAEEQPVLTEEEINAKLDALINNGADTLSQDDDRPIILGGMPDDGQPIILGDMPNDSQPIILGDMPNDSQPIILGDMPDDGQPIILGDMPNDSQPIILGTIDNLIIPQSDPEGDALAAELDALMNEQPQQEQPTAQSTDDADMGDDLSAVLDAFMSEQPQQEQPTAQDNSAEQNKDTAENTDDRTDSRAELDAARAMMEQARIMMEQAQAQTQAQAQAQLRAQTQAHEEPPRPVQPPQEQKPQYNEAAEAREMMAKAELMMEQARQAQMQAQLQAQAFNNIPPQHIVTTTERDSTATEAAREMMRQAQMMMQQAHQAQIQAQNAAQQAQLQAQLQVRSSQPPQPTMPITDPYAAKEVERLKNELDSMRELVNKLTFTLAQNQNPTATQTGAQAQQRYVYDPERDQYRKLETELDRMRRDIMEKDLRDREKELDRRQKEAENSIKDIRPEMVQMSDSRDVMPLGSQPPVGGEFIPLANGVFYSIKDKQVYVMTPASNAAAARPTIEQPRPTPVKKKTVVRTSARRKSAPPRRSQRRRPPSGRRPSHR